jgi:phage shock protein A
LLRSVSALSAELSQVNDELRRARKQIAALTAEAERRAADTEALQQRRQDWASAARQGLHVVVAGGGKAA